MTTPRITSADHCTQTGGGSLSQQASAVVAARAGHDFLSRNATLRDAVASPWMGPSAALRARAYVADGAMRWMSHHTHIHELINLSTVCSSVRTSGTKRMVEWVAWKAVRMGGG
eukprot:CAMPEP_0174835700 /NCGR_PEP_ID=MMETSP1114-20130205/5544_1 /TAXON_ID=312471 /ORGANISM="Neobodo designis, Strain CCAP 1951/1" /LENGTH=113 /DNA_ID=CAMNT_0016069653 /DNA_START=571 /DNA_END=913 /DNA_ORIENTATION=+